MRLIEDYLYESEEDKEQEQQASKRLNKKELPKKPKKGDLSDFNESVNKNETGINRELFQKHFSFQRPSDMLKAVYTANNKKEKQ